MRYLGEVEVVHFDQLGDGLDGVLESKDAVLCYVSEILHEQRAIFRHVLSELVSEHKTFMQFNLCYNI